MDDEIIEEAQEWTRTTTIIRKKVSFEMWLNLVI